MTLPLVTLDEAKEFMGIRPTNAGHDMLITALVMASTLELEHATQREFEYGNKSQRFNTLRTCYGGDRQNMQFFLHGINVDGLSPVDVWYDPDLIFGADTKLTPITDYIVDTEEAVIHLKSNTWPHKLALKVDYVAGYVSGGTPPTLSDTAPADLKSACLFQTLFMFKRHRSDNVGMTGERGLGTDQTGVSSEKWNTPIGLCKEAQGLARPYRRVVMGRG
jgi:hypothetical protein